MFSFMFLKFGNCNDIMFSFHLNIGALDIVLKFSRVWE